MIGLFSLSKKKKKTPFSAGEKYSFQDIVHVRYVIGSCGFWVFFG